MSVGTSSSSTAKEPEDIMICLDNSWWMESNKSPMFKEQAEAIELYCSKKINSHPENTVGVAGMSEANLYCLVFPTRNLSQIMNAIYVARIGGYLDLKRAVSYAYSIWFGNLDRDKQKRIVVFAGGVVYHRIHHIEILGEAMKRRNLACDVINFGDQFMGKKKLLNRLIDIVDNNNGNCNICHVPPELSVCEALSRSQIIIPRVGGSAPSPPSASLPLQHDRAKQTIEICVKAATGAPDVLGECPFCQRVLLTLELKKLPYITHLINMENKPEWFVEVNLDGIVPLIKFDDEKWVSNSDVIVDLINEKYPKPALRTPPECASLGLKILPKVGEFIKSKGEKYGIEQALFDELEELDKHLLKHGPYVNGRKKTAVDLSLAPKLYHLEVALGHFKKWTVPETLTHVHMYTKSLYNSKSFKKTKPSEYHVIAGWEAKVNP
ncbi:dehydroascorbate reductase 2 [Artemisia annua]|uniref:Dehydroascorbate reductase 2 n=1 Tax=Artemisia annua TaxID=35608 RepID=A0A2U1NI67_ARTAN|nr:dehydroascorbate reductase 2 [Artemisia annua]